MAHAHAPANRPDGYIPAAGKDWLLPLYDPALRWLMREDVFKRRLVEQADVRPGHRVLDLGCGTATLTLLVARSHPDAAVHGVDGDPKVLELARRKIAAAGLPIELDQALATELPYASESFDRAVSSLVIHHLTHDEKLQALREVRRVLRPGGSFHVVDFGPPAGRLARLLTHLAHSSDRLRENLAGSLPDLFRQAGFSSAEARGQHRTPFGTLSFYSGGKS